MMKRVARPVDVSKLRRNFKNRSRLTDTMCYGIVLVFRLSFSILVALFVGAAKKFKKVGYIKLSKLICDCASVLSLPYKAIQFFILPTSKYHKFYSSFYGGAGPWYLGGFAYLKFILIWLVCIALDLLIGFRFELLYPVWLSIRNCYDSFRLQGLISSFHYSAFSVIFICATLASDLIFFVLLPVQILLFLASSYIWIQFAWQTGERGFGPAQLFLWIVLISFEYNWRYRGDSPVHLFLESSFGSVINFLTGGLLSSLLGLRVSSSSASVCDRSVTSLSGCQYSSKDPSSSLLGSFGAAVTTAFAHSTTFGSVLCRPFAAHCIGYPVVTLGFGIKTHMSLWRVKRRQREVSKENDFYGKLLAEALPFVYEGSKMYPCANGLLADQDTIADYETDLPLSNHAICAPNTLTGVAPMRKSLRNVGSWKQQNGWRANGISNTKKLSQVDSNIIASRREGLSVHDEDDSASSSSIPSVSRLTLWRLVWNSLWSVCLLFSKGNVGESSSQLDDRLSLSSNEVDSEEDIGNQDDTSQIDDGFNRFAPNRSTANKRPKANCLRPKGGRTRNAKPQNHTDLCLPAGGSGVPVSVCNVNNVLAPNCSSQEKHLCSVPANPSTVYSSTNIDVCTTGPSTALSSNSLYIAELESLREELKTARCEENELRCHVQQATNAEKQARVELLQVKSKYEQAENKLSNCLKAREQDRTSMQLMEKRLIEAQTKAKELEKDLANEKKLKEQFARASIHNAKTAECNEACKVKKADLERELRLVRRELKLKDDLISSYEEKLKQIQEQKENNDVQELQATINSLTEKCQLLEQSLSAENRLKQDLFRVLTKTRTEAETLQQQLLDKDIELVEARTRYNSDACERTKHLSVNNTHPSVSLLRAPPGLPPPMTNGSLPNAVPRKLSSSISNEHNMEILTAMLSNAANNAYRSYAFNGHSPNCERSIFDCSPNGSAQTTKTSPATSISPPPISHNTGKSDAVESGRFSASKFVAHGSNSTSIRST